jgi:hypothetical protein
MTILSEVAAEEPFDWEKSGLLNSLEGDAISSRQRRLSFPAKLPILEKRTGSGTNWRPTSQAAEGAVRAVAIRHKVVVPRYSGSLSGGQRK